MVKNRVRELRRIADESQAKLGAAIGVSRATIHSIERHKHENIDGKTMLKIAAHFNKSVEDIFFIESIY